MAIRIKHYVRRVLTAALKLHIQGKDGGLRGPLPALLSSQAFSLRSCVRALQSRHRGSQKQEESFSRKVSDLVLAMMDE